MTRRVDSRQLALDFSLPVRFAPAPALAFHVPATAEEAETLAAVPFGQRWQNYVAVGAVPERIDVPLLRKNKLTLNVTGTRLGWTSGCTLSFRRPVGPGANPREGTGCFGLGGGGYLHPDSDEHAFFLWTSRAAAIRSAAHQAWWACWRLDGKLAAEAERALEKAISASPVQAPGDEDKRRLVSRDDGQASLERRRAEPGADVPESLAINEYRRACGLSDTTVWRAAA